MRTTTARLSTARRSQRQVQPQQSESPPYGENSRQLRAAFGLRENEPVRIRYDVVAASIRYLRNEKGWRQSDLARYAGVAIGTVSGVEVGRRTLLSNLSKIARALDVDPIQLVSGEFAHGEGDLSDHAVDVARKFERATPGTQTLIRRLLEVELNPVADRFGRLERSRQETVLRILALQEQAQGLGRIRVHKPKDQHVG